LGVEDSFTDPQFSLQWHLENTAQRTDTDRMVPGEDANVLEAWNLEFPSTVYDGAGVLIAIVDNGLWHQHVDLAPNYEPSASIDLVDGDLDPSPSVPVSEPGLGIHGSTMASIAAASHSTGPSVPGDCGVGVAFGSRLSGIRMIGGALSGATNPELLRAALLHANSQVDIYSNSWGADDQTPDLYTLSTMEESALNNGTANGRNGKGSIYVFAGGNGMPKDNTNASGFPASRFTIAVTGTSYDGKKNLFTEPGSSLMLNAPTGGEKLRDVLVTSTGRPDGLIDTCSSNGEDGYGVHSSAATAVVSGVIALMLQANPELSWRSVQQILARTAEKNDPTTLSGAVTLLDFTFMTIMGLDESMLVRQYELPLMMTGLIHHSLAPSKSTNAFRRFSLVEAASRLPISPISIQPIRLTQAYLRTQFASRRPRIFAAMGPWYSATLYQSPRAILDSATS